MGEIMKNILPAAVLIAALIIVPLAAAADTAGTGTVGNAPPFAMSLYGNITLDGEPAPVGTVITAEINGNLAGEKTVDQEGTFGEKPWGRLVVNGNSGDNITIKVNGFEVGKLVDENGDEITFAPGLVLIVDISATTPTSTDTDNPNTAVVTGRRSGGGGGGTYYPGNQQQQAQKKTDDKKTTPPETSYNKKTTTSTQTEPDTTAPAPAPAAGDEKGSLLTSLFGLFLPGAGAGTMLISWTILISIVSTLIYLFVRRKYLE